jgi:hydrogenase maturation protein HypF
VSLALGELGSVERLRAYRETLAHFCQLLAVRPEAVVADRHPDFAARRVVADLDLPLYEVQHHHAHLSAVLAEHGRSGPALGLVLDGFGLGDDGTAWGGELLLVEHGSLSATGALETAPAAWWRGGGAAAVAIGDGSSGSAGTWARGRFGALVVAGRSRRCLEWWQAERLSPPTTACGRYFQAAAACSGCATTRATREKRRWCWRVR